MLDKEFYDGCSFGIDEGIEERGTITIRHLRDDNERKSQLNMKNGIGVSVIIPVYNTAETSVSLAVKVLSEPHLVIELIITDDGFTDGTGNVLRQTRSDRLTLIKQASQGVYAARNAALVLHQGE